MKVAGLKFGFLILLFLFLVPDSVFAQNRSILVRRPIIATAAATAKVLETANLSGRVSSLLPEAASSRPLHPIEAAVADWQRIDLPDGRRSIEQLCAPFRARGYLCEENGVVVRSQLSGGDCGPFIQPETDDTFAFNQWGRSRIRATEASELLSNLVTAEVTVSVIDDGVHFDHPEFLNSIRFNGGELQDGMDTDGNGFFDDLVGYNFGDNNFSPYPENGWNHGTRVSSQIAANIDNGLGIAGVSQAARVIPIRVFNRDNLATFEDVARAVVYSVTRADQNADGIIDEPLIINMSIGCRRNCPVVTVLEDSIREAHAAGALIVVAAGNGYFNTPNAQTTVAGDVSRSVFTRLPETMAIAATNLQDERASFSNFGLPQINSSGVSLAAPGIDQFLLAPPRALGPSQGFEFDSLDEYRCTNGTSFSAPLVSGAAAMVWSANPHLSNRAVQRLLERNSDPISDITIGAGIVNAEAAVRAALPAFVTGSGAGFVPRVRVFDSRTGASRGEVAPYGEGFLGGVAVAYGDVNGDGQKDIVTAPGAGGGPHIRTFDGIDLQPGSEFYAYDSAFTGGVFVATGDVNGDGRDDIITGAGAGGGPHVRVLDAQSGIAIADMFPYAANFFGGVRVASADVNNDDHADIITAPGPGGGPHIRVINSQDPSDIKEFFAYNSSFFGGVWVAAGDLNGDGIPEIVTGPGPGGGPHVRAFDVSRPGFPAVLELFPYDGGFRGGVRVAVTDIDNDGVSELVTSPGEGGGPHLRVFRATGTNNDGLLILEDVTQLFAFDSSMTGGVFVGG